jgi:hypothetical protein
MLYIQHHQYTNHHSTLNALQELKIFQQKYSPKIPYMLK